MSIKFHNAIICDNAYLDQHTQKFVLAGVYSGDLLFDRIPNAARFAVYIDFVSDTTETVDLDLQMHYGGKQIGGVRQPYEVIDGVPSSILTPQLEVPFDHADTFTLRVATGGGKPKTLLSKKFGLRPTPPSS